MRSEIDPMRLGLPTPERLRSFRIWDSYFTPAFGHPGEDGSSQLITDIERSLPAIRKGQFEKLCWFAHVGVGTTTDPSYEKLAKTNPEVVFEPMRRWPDLLLGMIQLNGHDISASLDAINRWIADGPMVGVYFPGGGPAR